MHDFRVTKKDTRENFLSHGIKKTGESTRFDSSGRYQKKTNILQPILEDEGA